VQVVAISGDRDDAFCKPGTSGGFSRQIEPAIAAVEASGAAQPDELIAAERPVVFGVAAALALFRSHAVSVPALQGTVKSARLEERAGGGVVFFRSARYDAVSG
jgi:hypothetical protein